jgi:exonuclease III
MFYSLLEYKLDITCLSEIQGKDSSEIKTQNGNYVIFSSATEDKEHRYGVGFLMNKEAQKA